MREIINSLKNNWKSGLTVSLVSIPLALALSISSGATPTQGIITAFWAGLLGGIFGNSNFNIIGPTGALAGILITYSLSHGYASLPIIAILSGIIILLSWFFRLDKYIIFIPKSVVHGFTLGVAFIIGFGQLDNALGIQGLVKTESFIHNLLLVLQNIGQTQIIIFLIFIASIFFILTWNKKFPKIPGSAIIAFLGIIFMLLFPEVGHKLGIVTLGEQYTGLMPTLFENIFNDFSIDVFLDKSLRFIAMATATISILETLLSGQIASGMTKTTFNRSKEVLGLSIANIGSGLMGGIPATAALARTTLNIKSGAKNKFSAIINGIFLGIIAIFFIQYFKALPMVIIASILFVVAIGMIERKHFIHLLDNEKISFILSIFVSFIVVLEDPIIGIIIGATVALLIFVNKVANGKGEILLRKDGKMIDILHDSSKIKTRKIDSDLIVYKISGTLTYLNMPYHLENIENIKNNKYVIISLRHSFYADIDGIDYIGEIIETLKKNNNAKIILTGINKNIERPFKNASFYKKKLTEKKIYDRTSDAINDIKNKNI